MAGIKSKKIKTADGKIHRVEIGSKADKKYAAAGATDYSGPDNPTYGESSSSKLPNSFAKAMSQFDIPSTNPFADLIASAQQINQQRKAAIESDYATIRTEAEQTGRMGIEGAKATASRFSGAGLDTFMDSFVSSKVAESDKRLKDIQSAKDTALANADTELLTTLSNIQLKEIERNDSLRERQINNAFKLMDTQARERELDPEYRRFSALLEKYPQAGIEIGDDEATIAQKLAAMPLTAKEKADMEYTLALSRQVGRGGTGSSSGDPTLTLPGIAPGSNGSKATQAAFDAKINEGANLIRGLLANGELNYNTPIEQQAPYQKIVKSILNSFPDSAIGGLGILWGNQDNIVRSRLNSILWPKKQ